MSIPFLEKKLHEFNEKWPGQQDHLIYKFFKESMEQAINLGIIPKPKKESMKRVLTYSVSWVLLWSAILLASRLEIRTVAAMLMGALTGHLIVRASKC